MPITAERVAVTHEQLLDPGLDVPVRKVNRSDKGAPDFIALYGDVSAELEAMPPTALREMLRKRLKSHIEPARLRTLKLAGEEERKGLEQL